MPRPKFNDYTFYKIVNINGDIDLCYVGSTANMKQRNKQHKQNSTNENIRDYNFKIYKTIREHGGWDEFKMIEIATQTHLTKRQAEQIEEIYRVELKANMNAQRCFQTEQQLKEYTKQYRIDNINKLLEYEKQYRIDNADKIKETSKNYRIDNVDKIKERDKQYRINNTDKIKETNKNYRIANAHILNEKQECNCGGRYTTTHKSRHLKSQKHLNYVKSLTENQVIVILSPENSPVL